LKEEIVIYQPWGGLGDNLAHTVIPRLCEMNNVKCFLSHQNAYRNQQIYEFVWKNNPYLAGMKDSEDMSWLDQRPDCAKRLDYNEIQTIQKTHGFEPITEYPDIHYTPSKINKFEGKTIVDLSAYSVGRDINNSLVRDIMSDYNFKKDDTIELTHSQVTYGTAYRVTPENFAREDVNDIFTYRDILYSCKRFIALCSGPATLASTIKNKMNTDCCINILIPGGHLPGTREGGYTYSNTNYIQCD